MTLENRSPYLGDGSADVPAYGHGQSQPQQRSQESVAVIVVDKNQTILYFNDAAGQLYGRESGDVIGCPLSTVFTYDWLSSEDEQQAEAALAAGGSWHGVIGHLRPDGVSIVVESTLSALKDQQGNDLGILCVLRDTERHQLEADLRQSEERLRLALEGAHIGTWHWNIVTDHLYCSEILMQMRGISSSPANLKGFLQSVHPADRPMKEAALHEALVNGADYDIEIRVVWPDGTIRWLAERGRPYRDGSGSVVRLEGVAIDITAREVAEQELREYADRESLLNSIGHALRTTLDPDKIQQTIATELGIALNLDRCYYVTYDSIRDTITVGRDWHESDLPSFAGVYPGSEYWSVVQELFLGGTAVIDDLHKTSLSERTMGVLDRGGYRALVAVPFLHQGNVVAALFASTTSPRHWVAHDILTIEEAATLTRSAMALATVNQREHNIAHRLQSALQPAIPHNVPGLKLGYCYRAALQEANVGGDFADVFSDEPGITFIVVGDVSGKGLAAASQVAAVRNMLRFALINGRTLNGPIAALNRTVERSDDLFGFVTLFVGRYDAHTRELKYVNCGQDPGLVLRNSSGLVDQLVPTGAVVGAFEDASYEEAAVVLQPGDILALFTDGLTEAGPSRVDSLATEGLVDLLLPQAGSQDPESVVGAIMAGVDSFSRGGIPDDQCLLVCIAS